MQCEFCNNKATVFFTQILDGVSKKSCLCDSCANEKGVTDPEGFLLAKGDLPFSSEVGGGNAADTPKAGDTSDAADTPEGKAELPHSMDDQACCPRCSFTFEDLKKIGRLGCSHCYTFFRREIKHNLTGMHKGSTHLGCAPEGMAEELQKRQKREILNAGIAAAISDEDYEKAAQLRDQIRQLEADSSLTPDS